MSYKVSFNLGLIVCALLAIGAASPVAAYNPTDATAQQRGSEIALFTITVPIAAGSRTLHLPVRPANHSASSTTAFSFEIFSDTSPVAVAGTIGAVISDAPIENDEYILRPGQASTFTIVVAAIAQADAPPQQLRMRVTEFPLYLGNEREAVALNQFELANYETPKITLR